MSDINTGVDLPIIDIQPTESTESQQTVQSPAAITGSTPQRVSSPYAVVWRIREKS